MKKLIGTLWIIAILTMCFLFMPAVHAENENVTEGGIPLDTENQSVFVEWKEKSEKTIQEYTNEYGSKAYGITAFALQKISVYSIPFCFLGIAISGIYQYVIGIRKLDIQERGLTLMVAFVTILVICQILPLAFTIVVKFGRG